MNGIQVSLNEGPRYFSKEEIIAKKTLTKFKNSYPETPNQFHPNLTQCIFVLREFKFIQIKDPLFFQEEIIKK